MRGYARSSRASPTGGGAGLVGKRGGVGWPRTGRPGRSLQRTNPWPRGTGCAGQGGHSVSGGGEEGGEGEGKTCVWV